MVLLWALAKHGLKLASEFLISYAQNANKQSGAERL